MSVEIRNEAIAASAGSGKTFQLAHRYIQLLFGGVKPSRIAALTFSRKAAGEIFDSIVKYLSEAAVSRERARRTGGLIGRKGLEPGDYLALLRTVLANLHRLQIGTLDSFTVNIIRSFPMELGISPGFQVMDNAGAEAETSRREVLAKIFDHRQVRKSAQRRFLQAFKQATYGNEEKSLGRLLEKFTGEYHGYYQVLPSEEGWGRESVIWPDGSPWLTTVEDVGAEADALEALLAGDDLPERVMERWRTFLDAVRVFGFGSAWGDEIKYLFNKLIAVSAGLGAGTAVIGIGHKKYPLTGEKCRLALSLLTHIMYMELTSAVTKTKGIYRILDQYEELYDEMIRRQGKLTFSDAQYLLTEANRHSGGALISRASRQQARLYIDYRLDCRLDHWLLDEFQDTSDLQWEVLGALIDEILQDDSGRRSFFYVGDVKQAIYGWRGGNFRLFRSILDRYPERITERPLNTSFRSCRPVIDTVNRVFGALPPGVLPAATLTEWNKVWVDHRCEEDAVPGSGYAALLEPPSGGGKEKPTEDDRYGCVTDILRDIDPLNRGLSAAILVRSNESGRKVVDYLRRHCGNMTIVHEGKAVIKDNAVVALLLSLVKFAAHPGDTFAGRHLHMSPLARHFTCGGASRSNPPAKLLRRIQEVGFQPFIREWGSRLEAASSLDDYGRKRLKDLVGAATEFDGRGSRDCDDFLRFIDNYEIHELAAGDAIRVMTIHQAKGLGFDIVILPDLQSGDSIARAHRIEFLTARDPGTTLPLWTLKMPRREVALHDPVLGRQIEVADEAAAFENMCVLYVAMTRARHGLYMVTSYPGSGANTIRSSGLLKTQLADDPKPADGPSVAISGNEYVCLYETGDRDWYKGAAAPVPTGKAVLVCEVAEEFGMGHPGHPRLRRVSPSARGRERQSAASLFEAASRERREFGSAVHELFSKLTWAGEADVEGLTVEWLAASHATPAVKEAVAGQFRHALETEEVRRALSRPAGDVELWREKRFDIVLGDQWITGAFDRVTIVRDESGAPSAATILDYKSNVISGEADLAVAAEQYRPQLETYQRALSRMLNLPPGSITLQLLFTRPGKVYDLSQ